MKKILLFFLLLSSLSLLAEKTLSIDEALNRVGNDRESYEFKKFSKFSGGYKYKNQR